MNRLIPCSSWQHVSENAMHVGQEERTESAPPLELEEEEEELPEPEAGRPLEMAPPRNEKGKITL